MYLEMAALSLTRNLRYCVPILFFILCGLGPRLCCPAFPFKPMKNNCVMLTKLLLLLLQLLSMLLSAAGCALRQPKSKTCFPCNYKGIIVESWDLKQRKCS
ncbi:unnamed protein product [Arctia plantaginis]|uniref:Uncharacterized protein n=1 Tax=Arctia plantaginis TaxID=874455 RepID=A0A8S0ZJX2_ARCPL|nr:unnamed protein product [Arctia plantaginis]